MKRKPMKAPEPVAEILQSMLKRRGLAKKINQYGIFEIWAELVGPTIAQKAAPKKVQGDTLIVTAKNAAWAHELSYMKPLILKKMHERMPSAEIRDIRFIAEKP